MRNVTMIATKNHLVFVILADTIGDELTVTDLTMSSNGAGVGMFLYSGIGFGVEGGANTFHYKNSAWEHHGEYITPCLNTRYNANTDTTYFFGGVATSNSSVYVGVIPREDSVGPDLIQRTQDLANTSEVSLLQQSSNTAFQLFQICHAEVRRDLNTFESVEIIPPNISDSEVTII
jgi:hypothetical protein